MTTFRFRSLESDTHFRVLYLQDCAGDEQLSGSLVHHNLDEHPTYDCLSYVWGCPTLSHNVLVDGAPFPVTANLYSALKRIRARNSDGLIAIWADGICINQEDIPERNQQMSLMRRIYSECRMGLMYLGEAADGSDLLPEFLETLVQSITALFKGTNRFSTLDFEDGSAFPDKNDPGWEKLRAFLRRPWFKRVWIIQEFALPPQMKMICGQWEIPGTYLANLLQIPIWTYSRSVLASLINKETIDAIGNHRVHLGVRRAAGREGFLDLHPDSIFTPDASITRLHQSLLWLLDQSRSFLATDPRDKIFALMHLSSDFKDSGLTVDYSKSVESVTAEVAQYLIRNGYGLSLLLGAGLLKPSTDSCSWYPDWTHPRPAEELNIWSRHLDRIPDCQIISNPGTQTITMNGSIVDIVQDLGVLIGSQLLLDNDNKWIRDLDAFVADIQTYPTGQAVDEAVWRTLVADQSVFDLSPAPESYGQFYRACRAIQKLPSRYTTFLNTTTVISRNWFNFERSRFRACRFSMTRKELFSILPKDAEVDDSIFVVKGDPNKYMFLVRKDTVLNQYRLIGQAYVHGIWSVLKLDDLEDIAITLY